jgi:predicted nuclease of predicted toxin-antitoxin system
LYHGLNGKTDTEIWDVAKKEELVIVTFDEDYFEMMMIKGFPPKVIWLRIGNSSTNEIVELLEKNFDEIKLFIQNNEVGLLELY